MNPAETAKNYDEIASWWLEQMKESDYGLPALERALRFLNKPGEALDIGCGCEGRHLKLLLQRGFRCAGLDISPVMIELAAQRYPSVEFFTGDICSWQLPRQYDLILAWDSTFHLPLESHEAVIRKLCAGLSRNGVLLFSCGGGNQPGTAKGEFGGRRFEYSTLGIPRFVQLLQESDCSIRHLEYDQYPENHAFIIAQRAGRSAEAG